MKKEYLNAQNVEDLVEIVKAVQNGEDPGDRLKKKAEEEEAARKKAAEEEAAAREAAEKEKADREAAEKEEAAAKRAARKQAAAERRAQKNADEESALDEDDEEQSEGKTQRRYGANSVSDKAETVGNRILRSLHMEHLEEPPSEEAVEALIKDLPTEDKDKSEDEPEKTTKEEETMTQIDGMKAETDEKLQEDLDTVSAEEEEDKDLPEEEDKPEKEETPEEEEMPAEEETAPEEEPPTEEMPAEEETVAGNEESPEEETEESGEEDLKELRSEAAEDIEESPEEESEEGADEETEEEPGEVKSVRTKKGTMSGRTGMLIATGVIVVGIAALMVGSAVSGPNQNTEVETPETEEAEAADLTDGEAPVLSAVNSGGVITLNASDEDSGVDTIWYAVVEDGGLSDLPQYQVYEEPITYEEGNTYYFYAVDQAGNQSELITIPE